MKIKILKQEEQEQDIRYLCLDVQPRYWEDGTICGEDDISWDEQKEGKEPRMPLSYDNGSEYTDEHYSWRIKINFDDGKIVDWPNGISANIHYKVCDQGTYWLETEDGKIIHKIDSYVPGILDFYKKSYGDYLVMTITEDGYIKEWNKEKQASLIEGFLKEEGF